MSTDRALNNRDGAWQGAITSLDLIKPETVLAIRSGDASTIRSLDAREIRFVCAFALTALGEAHYLRSEALRAQGERPDVDPMPACDDTCCRPDDYDDLLMELLDGEV